MKDNFQTDSREVVVVLGPGRSGTSLVMQLLVAFGLQVSKNLIPANASNPNGFYEDSDIKEIQAGLSACLGASPVLPLPLDWLRTKCASVSKDKLYKVIQRNLECCHGLYGFKDPRTASFLPLWTMVFNSMRIVPKYVLAVRDPSSVLASFVRQYNDPPHVAELVWLLRTIEALENCAASCFIVHYEEWFCEPKPPVETLLQYTGLEQDFKGNLSDVLANIVKPNLNRASNDDYKIQNPYVLKLYAALQECHGVNFDRERLMVVVKECRRAMEGFKGWYQFAQRVNQKVANLQARLDKATAEAANVKTLEERIQVFEKEKSQSMQLAAQVQKLQLQLDHLVSLN